MLGGPSRDSDGANQKTILIEERQASTHQQQASAVNVVKVGKGLADLLGKALGVQILADRARPLAAGVCLQIQQTRGLARYASSQLHDSGGSGNSGQGIAVFKIARYPAALHQHRLHLAGL